MGKQSITYRKGLRAGRQWKRDNQDRMDLLLPLKDRPFPPYNGAELAHEWQAGFDAGAKRRTP